MENMNSCAWTDRQRWLVGSQSHMSQAVAQLTTMLNQRVGAEKASCHLSTSNTSLQPQVTGAYSNGQASTAPSPLPSYQEAVCWQSDGMPGNVIRQNSPSNSPSGNHHVLAVNGHQGATDGSGSASLTTHLSANIMKTSTSYHQQSISAPQNQQFRLTRNQPASIECGENMAAATPNSQTGYNSNTRQNNANYAFLYFTPPISNQATVVQSFNKSSTTGNSLSSTQILHSPSTGWKTQEYPAHLNSTNYSGGQRFTSQLLPTSTAQNQKQIDQMATRTAGYQHRSSSSSLHCFPQVDSSSLGRRKQIANKPWMTAYNQNIQCTTNSQIAKVSHSVQERVATGTVSVGQPLSQESYQHANKRTSFIKTNETFEHAAIYESLSDTEKLYVLTLNANDKTRQPNLYRESPKQIMSSLSSTSDSSAPNEGHSVSSSNSARNKSLSQTQLCADVNEPLVPINMEANHSVVQQPDNSGVQRTQYGQHNKCNKNKDQTDPKASYSSIPTVQWTLGELTDQIKNAEKDNTGSSKSSTASLFNQLLSSFWNNDITNMKSVLKTGTLRDIVTDVNEFCTKHVTLNAVILSEAKCRFKNLKSYRILKDEEVYSEVPYQSSWLNVNKQLDDIDKEFGFPWSLLYRHCISDNQPDDAVSVSQIPEQNETEVANEVLPGKEHKLAEEKPASVVETLSTETASVEEESSACSNSYYSFKIEVLPPEEAKIIFEQANGHKPQSMDTDSTPMGVTTISDDDDLPEATCVKLNDTNEESASMNVIEQLCCLSRWLATVCGSNELLLNECQCKNEQNLKDATYRPFNEEEMAVQIEDGLCVISFDDKLRAAKDIQDVSGENEMSTCNPSALDIKLSCTVENVSEYEPKTHLYPDNEPSSTSQMSISNIQSSNNDSEDLSSTEAKTPSESEMDCSAGHLESVKSTQSCASVNTDKEPECHPSSKSDVAHQILDIVETCGPLNSADVTKTSIDVKKTPQMISPAAFLTTSCLRSRDESVERNQKRQSSPKRLYPIFKKSENRNIRISADSQPSKCRNGLIDVAVAPKVRAFQLVPFGSSLPDKPVFHGGRNSHLSSAKASLPPGVLSVKLSPLKRDSGENVRPGEPSVKQRLFEKWQLSLPPPKSKHRSKVKSQRNTLARVTVKELGIVCPTNTETLPVSSETKIRSQNSTLCSNRKRKRRSHSGRREHKRRKKPKDESVFTHQEGSNTANSLSFIVLPDTFNFSDGSGKRRKAKDITR